MAVLLVGAGVGMGSCGADRSNHNSPSQASTHTQRRPTHHSGITVERTCWAGRPHDAHLPRSRSVSPYSFLGELHPAGYGIHH